MSVTPSSQLNDEIAHWRSETERLAVENGALKAENVALRARVVELEGRIAALVEQVATLSKIVFGHSSEKSASSSTGQASPEDATAPNNSFIPDDESRKRGQRPGSKGHGRRDYSHLETQEVIHDVADDEKVCRHCGADLSPFGEETCEQIDWHVKIIRVVHHRKRYRRNCRCNGPGIVIAPPLPKAIAKGRFTSRFLARLVVDKFCFGTPVNRIAASLGLTGAELSTGSLTGSLKAVSALLEPLETAIRARNSQAGHLHADETGWSVFEAVEGKDSNRWWLWVFVGPDTTVFRIEKSRSLETLTEHLGITNSELPEGHSVIVSSDFYRVYQSLSNNVEGFDSLWCWAHIRRYFIRAGDAHKELRVWADEWVLRIGALYAAHGAVGVSEPNTAEHARALASFDKALDVMDIARKHQANDVDLHERAHKVLGTLGNEWDGLVAHRDHLELPLDNNTAERALRGPVVGRKNYNGAGALWSANLASRAWTIITTAQRAGLNPLTYLTAYFDACGTHASKPLEGTDLARFLPWAASEQDLEAWRGPPP